MAQRGVAFPQADTALILGAIGAGITLIRGGADAAGTTAVTIAFVVGGLAASRTHPDG